jgi:hypothetical protein
MRGPTTVATWFMDHPAAPDVATLDQLAHWQLEAQRRGYGLQLVQPSTRLAEVVHLSGLAEVFGLRPAGSPAGPAPARHAGASEHAARPSVEVAGQPESDEVLFTEETVDPGDAAG